MNRYRPSRRRRNFHVGPLVAFLLIASFGILFAGCGRPPATTQTPDGSKVDDITFTQDDLARFQRLATGSGSEAPSIAGTQSGSVAQPPVLPLVTSSGSDAAPPVLDLSMVKRYQSMRAVGAAGENVYKVTNVFLNVRAEPRTGAASIGRLVQGDSVTVLEFVNATWSKIQMPGGKPGYVALQYLGKLTTDDKFAEDKKAFNGLYYVHFAFVNVRKNADQKSEKLGQIPGQTFVRPITIDKQWAKVSFQGKEGYVSADYLSPFSPVFIVRQDKFVLPILRYRLDDPGVAQVLADHASKLKQAGVRFLTFADLQSILLQQEQHKAAGVPPKSVIIAVSDATPDTVRKASDALYASGVPATFFLQTRFIGLSGITQKTLMTLVANGFDIQSGAHSGDDLRSLTNAQVKLEVEQSRKILEDAIGKTVFAIDYPQGGVNDRVAEKAGEAGYLFGVGNAPDKEFLRDQFLRLPSYNVTSSMTTEDILNILK